MLDFGPRNASLVERVQQFQQRPTQRSAISFRSPPPPSFLHADGDHVGQGARPFRLSPRIRAKCDWNVPFWDLS
jgi:hypothetical protein